MMSPITLKRYAITRQARNLIQRNEAQVRDRVSGFSSDLIRVQPCSVAAPLCIMQGGVYAMIRVQPCSVAAPLQHVQRPVTRAALEEFRVTGSLNVRVMPSWLGASGASWAGLNARTTGGVMSAMVQLKDSWR